MPRSIDVAYFDCDCGHRSTPPDAINRIPHEMDVYDIIPAAMVQDTTTTATTSTATVDTTTTLQPVSIDTSALQADLPGNSIAVITTGEGDQVITIGRSYSTVSYQDQTDLTQSNHIILSCPNCGKQLYEGKWTK